jgi:hypothetical protein
MHVKFNQKWLISWYDQVDEDIEALDERTEDNRKDCDSLHESLKAFETRLASTEAATSSGPPAAQLRQEIEAVLLAKDLATKSDLLRGLKTIPFGLSKEEVGQMIEFATRNFLRTVQGGKFTDMFTINDSVHTQEPSKRSKRKFKELQYF